MYEEASKSYKRWLWSMEWSLLWFVSQGGNWLHDRDEIQRRRRWSTWTKQNCTLVSWHRWLNGDGRTTITDPTILLSVGYRFVSRNRISLNSLAFDSMRTARHLSDPGSHYLSSSGRSEVSARRKQTGLLTKLNSRFSLRILSFPSFRTTFIRAIRRGHLFDILFCVFSNYCLSCIAPTIIISAIYESEWSIIMFFDICLTYFRLVASPFRTIFIFADQRNLWTHFSKFFTCVDWRLCFIYKFRQFSLIFVLQSWTM